MKRFSSIVAGLTLTAALAHADMPKIVDVKVYPADVNLSSKVDRQSIVVQAWYSDSIRKT